MAMCDEWMPNVTLSLTPEQYEQLPRHPAYQYDYLRGTAILSPRPKHFHGVLDFTGWQSAGAEDMSPDVEIRMMPEERADLVEVFADAFERVQPFAGLAREARANAARLALEKVWQGGDGPWIKQASFTAVHATKEEPLGAVTITLVPGGDPGQAENYRWQEPAPEAWEKGSLGQPHLTWIFVSPLWKGIGVGSALLGEAVGALRAMGYGSLWTTFLLGNDASMLWHWRNGFVLAQCPQSRRAMRRELRGR
jgi:GNAT superfamily N-acetyltransferase